MTPDPATVHLIGRIPPREGEGASVPGPSDALVEWGPFFGTPVPTVEAVVALDSLDLALVLAMDGSVALVDMDLAASLDGEGILDLENVSVQDYLLTHTGSVNLDSLSLAAALVASVAVTGNLDVDGFTVNGQHVIDLRSVSLDEFLLALTGTLDLVSVDLSGFVLTGNHVIDLDEMSLAGVLTGSHLIDLDSVALDSAPILLDAVLDPQSVDLSGFVLTGAHLIDLEAVDVNGLLTLSGQMDLRAVDLDGVLSLDASLTGNLSLDGHALQHQGVMDLEAIDLAGDLQHQGVVDFEQLDVERYTSGGNEVTNGGFEAWSAGMPDGWTDDSGGTATFTEDTSSGLVRAGGSALKVTHDVDGQGFFNSGIRQSVFAGDAAGEGRTFYVEAWARSENPGDSSQPTLWVGSSTFNGGFTTQLVESLPRGTTRYTRLSGFVSVPKTHDWVRVELRGGNGNSDIVAGESIWWDAVSFKQVAVAADASVAFLEYELSDYLASKDSWVSTDSVCVDDDNHDGEDLAMRDIVGVSNRDAYMGWDLSNIPSIGTLVQADFIVHTKAVDQATGAAGFEVFKIANADEGWDETTITCSNRPPADGAALAQSPGLSAGNDTVIVGDADIEARIDERRGVGFCTFLLQANSGDAFTLESKDQGANDHLGPRLRLFIEVNNP